MADQAQQAPAPASETTAPVTQAAPPKRKFTYNGMEIPDIPGLEPADIQRHWAITYEGLGNATLSGPKMVDGEAVFTFTRAIEKKG